MLQLETLISGCSDIGSSTEVGRAASYLRKVFIDFLVECRAKAKELHSDQIRQLITFQRQRNDTHLYKIVPARDLFPDLNRPKERRPSVHDHLLDLQKGLGYLVVSMNKFAAF